MQRKQVTIVGDSDAGADACAAAEAIGRCVASVGAVVITGGRGGVMAAACRGAAETGGIAIGILPGDDASEANEWCTVVVPTGLGHARNAINALAGDVLVVIGESAGTISEACFAWIHGRPLLVHSRFSPWIEGFAQTGLDPRPGGRLVICRETDELSRHLRSWLES